MGLEHNLLVAREQLLLVFPPSKSTGKRYLALGANCWQIFMYFYIYVTLVIFFSRPGPIILHYLWL